MNDLAPSTSTQPADAPDELIDTPALARILGLAAITVKTWRQQGRGPRFIKIARSCVRYRRSDVAAWLASRTATSTTSAGPVGAP